MLPPFLPMQDEFSQILMHGNDIALVRGHKSRLVIIITPAPGIPEPNSRKDMNRRILFSSVMDRNADKNILLICFGILYEDIEVSTLPENTRILQLEFRIRPGPPAIL